MITCTFQANNVKYNFWWQSSSSRIFGWSDAGESGSMSCSCSIKTFDCTFWTLPLCGRARIIKDSRRRASELFGSIFLEATAADGEHWGCCQSLTGNDDDESGVDLQCNFTDNNLGSVTPAMILSVNVAAGAAEIALLPLKPIRCNSWFVDCCCWISFGLLLLLWF